jgi:hypothetical protein
MPNKPFNPFYALLVVLGIVFAITVCAYVVMMFKLRTAEGISHSAGEWLVQFMDKHGFSLLIGELVLLGIATFAAIGTDEYWTKRNKEHQKDAPHDSAE